MACPTLGDRPVEEPSRAGHGHERGGAHPPRRFAKDRDVIRIASESGDVLLHPGESGDLVEHAQVSNAVIQVEEAISTQTIVDGDADHSITGETRAIIGWHGPRSVGESATMNPDHDWQPGLSQV